VTPALRGAFAYYGLTRLYSVDFEYQPFDGDNQKPICLCYRDLFSGRSDKVWLWERSSPPCPFAMGEREAFIGYNFAAEAGCFAALGWPKSLSGNFMWDCIVFAT
jgi:hypothetical protein